MSTLNNDYYYLLMSQKDLLKNEVIEEILREKTSYYLSKNKNKDFWLLNSPIFTFDETIKTKIHKTNFFINKQKDIVIKDLINLNKNLEYYSCILSTDKEFVNWIELRIGYFENLDLNLDNKINYFSNGVKGKLFRNYKYKNNGPLNNFPNYLHPYFYNNKNDKFIELYCKNLKNKLVSNI